MQDLTVTIMQSSIVWEDIQANLEIFKKKILSLGGGADIIVLPEMFTTGFSMNPACAVDMASVQVRWMLDMAVKSGAAVAGSMIIREGDFVFNRLLWAAPDGRLLAYDKRHLFRMAGEEKVFSPGDRTLVIEHCGWRISPFICYDLRFPAWMRNCQNRYDVALVSANWPAKRSGHWNTLLAARAIENQCYVVACNRVGADGNGVSYKGDSSVIDPAGAVIARESSRECVITASLSCDLLGKYREEFPVWKDADDFNLQGGRP